MECDAGEGQSENHTRGGPDHDLASTDDVNVFQSEEGENEIGAGDDQSDSGGLVEADGLEQRRAVVPEYPWVSNDLAVVHERY